jgi:alpha-methylacyl-CoA racemase
LAGHDLTYLAVAGVLDAFAAEDGRPVPPLNLLGDFGGGGMLLALGVVSALWHARESGQGQVVDAAIVDGVAAMTAMHQSMLGSGLWHAPRGANLFDGGAPFYRCYRTADDRWLAVGAIEPVFYDRFVSGLGVPADEVGAAQLDPTQWPRLAEVFAERIAAQPLAHWVAVFADLDACVAPVLTVQEARDDPHLSARGAYAAVPGSPGLVQPAPAPRFSATPTTAGPPATEPGSHTDAVERELGLTR